MNLWEGVDLGTGTYREWWKQSLSQEEPRHFKDKKLGISTLFIVIRRQLLLRSCAPMQVE